MSEEQKVDEVQTQENQSQAANSQTSVDLNINDLAAVRSIIDVATQRGAFKAAELEAVGKVYNKLNNFLESVTKKEA